MYNKKSETKFTIQFNRLDASHLQVADILNRQKRYGKAQYIVDAVIHYIHFGLTETAIHPVRLDEKHIEAVVRRILRDKGESGAGVLPASAPAGQVVESSASDITVDYDGAMEALGEDGVSAIAGALDMFRKR